MIRWWISFTTVMSLTLLLSEVEGNYRWVVYIAWLCSLTQLLDVMHRIEN
jgi:hypothetical protein